MNSYQQRANELRRERETQRKALGVCVKCGERVRGNNSRCEYHRRMNARDCRRRYRKFLAALGKNVVRTTRPSYWTKEQLEIF